MISFLPTAAFFSVLSYLTYSKYCLISKLTQRTSQCSSKLPSFLQSTPQLSPILSAPLLDLFSRGGKRIRILLTHSIAHLCCSSPSHLASHQPTIDAIAILIQSLHNASLIIDDIEDNSLVRRDEPVVHLKFGVKKSIISANFAYFKVFNEVLKMVREEDRLGVTRVFVEEMVVCHLGQGDDLYSPMMVRRGWGVVDFGEEDYMRMVVSKTGALLRMMVKMVGLVLGVEGEMVGRLVRIVEGAGAAFQIYDDYLNIKGGLGKGGVAEDIRERKMTLMVVKTLERGEGRFLEVFGKEEKTEEEVREVVECMERSGSFEYAMRKREECAGEVWREARGLPRGVGRDVLVMILGKIIYR